jgi:hypothetical protein
MYEVWMKFRNDLIVTIRVYSQLTERDHLRSTLLTSYAFSPTMLPQLETFFELQLWNDFQCCRLFSVSLFWNIRLFETDFSFGNSQKSFFISSDNFWQKANTGMWYAKCIYLQRGKRDSSVSIETRLRAGRPGFVSSRQGQWWDFSPSPLRQDLLWVPSSLLYNGYWGILPPGIKRLEHESDHSPPASAEVKNAWSYTFTSQYVLMAWYLVKHRESRCTSLSSTYGSVMCL